MSASLAVFIMSMVLAALAEGKRGRIGKRAYQWWYIPWFGVLYCAVAYVVYHKVGIPDLFFFSGYERGHVEIIYSLLCGFLWGILRMFLRSKGMAGSLLETYRDVVAKPDDPRRSELLPFPYMIFEGEVRGRIGHKFCKEMVRSFILIIAVVYSLFLIVSYLWPMKFYLLSGFTLLGLIPLVDYYIYLCQDAVAEEEEKEPVNDDAESDFDKLWALYVRLFGNFNLAWKKTDTALSLEQKTEEAKRNNESRIQASLNAFINGHDIIIEDYDIVTAFSSLIPFFLNTLKDGKNILVAIDIPKHFDSDTKKTYLDQFADKLTKILSKRFPNINEIIKFNVYDENSSGEVFNNKVVMSSVSVLSQRELFDDGWMRDLGLLIVVNLFDKGVSNLFENRKFGFMLRLENDKYRTIVIAQHRHAIQSAIENSWLMNSGIHETMMGRSPMASKLYFLGYNFENFAERFFAAFSHAPKEQLYSGSEFAVPALSTKGRASSPLHYLELAYSSTIEGKEELMKNEWLNAVNQDEFKVSHEDIENKMILHEIQVNDIAEEKMISVIHDSENNAPAMYMKWIHLGIRENMSILVSKPYMFRDFFYAKFDYYKNNPFSSLQPRLCNSGVTLAIILSRLLQKGSVKENDIKGYLRKYYRDDLKTSIPLALKDLFLEYLHIDLAEDLHAHEKVSFENNEYQKYVVFDVLHPDKIQLPFLDIISIRDESNNLLFEIVRDLLHQNYMVGQIHSFYGRPYLISHMDEVNKTLRVKKTDVTNLLFYRSCMSVKVLDDWKSLSPIRNMDYSPGLYYRNGSPISVSFQGFEGHVHLMVNNVISFAKYYHAPKYCHTSKILPVNEFKERDYHKGRILRLSIKYMRKQEYIDNIGKIRKGLQVLFYEAMYSVFPHHAQYLLVVSCGAKDDTLPWIIGDFSVKTQDPEDELTFYFIEDSNVDLGLIGALTWDHFQDIVVSPILDYLLWLNNGSEETPSGYTKYLTPGKEQDKFAFLKYGSNTLPDFFDTELLINFIRDNFGLEET